MTSAPPAPPLRRLLQEPHRVLFPLGLLAGMIGVGHWLAYAAGWSGSYSGFFHAGVQMQVYVTSFIAGFLMTAMPRFTGTRPASPGETLAVAGLLASVVAALAAGRWVLAQAAFAGVLLALAAFFAVRLARRRPGRRPRLQPPVELVWVGFALLHGLAGALLLAGGQAGRLPSVPLHAGRAMVQEGFVLAVVVGVGGFLAPRLMGTYTMPPPASGGESGRRRRTRLRLALHAAGGTALFASFLFQGLDPSRWGDLFRATLVTIVLILSGAVAPRPRVRELYVRLVWLALWMVLAGLWGAAILPLYRAAALHLVFLGGYSLMIFAVATMVVFSHAGEADRLRRPSWPLRLTGGGVVAAVALRVASVAVPDGYFELLGAAAAIWLAAAAIWLAHVAPRLLRTVPAADLERMHEEAKLRVVGTRGAGAGG